MSVRAALAALVLTAFVSFSAIIPEGPDKVRWTGLFWLSVYASVMLAQAAWAGWRWLSHRHATRS